MDATESARLKDGRDEMNLCEFPIACLSERAPPGVTTLEFEATEWDRTAKQLVSRKLTVEGSPKHGLPTAKDEEVLLGLIQLTKSVDNFRSSTVPFRQRELLELLGWSTEGRSYGRLDKAFHRLMGVRLYYENAWRDNANKQYVTQGGFGVLASFELCDSRKANGKRDGRQQSRFEWNPAFFDSFQSGYLKKLDYELVRSFRHAASKRLYRFLDKHFYPPKKTRLVLDLKVLAFEHLGMSRRHDVSAIKKTLTPAVAELESAGYLKTNETDRYRKRRSGEWEIVFSMAGRTRRPQSSPKRNTNQSPTAENCSKTDRPSEAALAIATLSESERERLESQAVAFCEENATSLAEGYHRTKPGRGPSFQRYRELVLATYVNGKTAAV